ncbi:MAG: CPBP family intramembrane metalloprotease [Flammeovirgaceae bacterium]|nr:CPBP family intramembrane metalloprotease [Flammeovirgaceae bacterium]
MEKSIGSDFLTLSKKGKNDWWRILLFILALTALPTVVSLTLDNIELPTLKDKENRLTLDIIVEGLAFSIVLIGVFFAVKLIHRRSFSTLNGTSSFKVKEFLEGLTVWGTLIIIGSILNQQTQWKYFMDNGLNSSLIFILPITALAIGIQSYTEEVVFRGYLLQILSLRIKNVVVLILICSSIFGILHGLDGLASIIGTTILVAISVTSSNRTI